MLLDAKINALQSFFDDLYLSLRSEMFTALKKYKKDIEEANKSKLLKGIDTEGKSLGRYKNFEYKQRFTPVDLKLTGDFHNSIKAEFSKTDFVIEAIDFKTKFLEKKYGENIVGISDVELLELVDLELPPIMQKLKNDISNTIR